MFSESIYTLEELAQHLKVSVDDVHTEIKEGRLPALHIGESIRVQESDLNEYKKRVRSSPAGNHRPFVTSGLEPTDDFPHTWPDGLRESYTNVREGVVRRDGREYRIKIGFTTRTVAGRDRRRALVLVDAYPTVEFVARDATVTNGPMASIIKDRHGKQLPAIAPPPPEYSEMNVGPYRDIVDGRYASHGLAVICDSDDLETMAGHALIRHTYRQDRRRQ